MQQEIDELFLENSSVDYTEESISDLEKYIDNFNSVIPHVKLLEEKIANVDTNFEFYNVKLERLANEMKDIEEQNTKLENEIMYQTEIYDTLKDLLIKLDINEEYFMILETEPFSNEGLIKIEEAIELMENFCIKNIKIRVVSEKQKRIDDALQKFFTKFTNYIINELKNE